MTDKERLEEIKEAIAHQLGLTDDWMDGTYLYQLTRAKSAFSVGTMTFDDFVEVDEELLNDIFEDIKPFIIQQAERVEELGKLSDNLKHELFSARIERDLLKEEVKALKKSVDFLEKQRERMGNNHQQTIKDAELLLKQNQRYKQALEFYADKETYEQVLISKAEQIDGNWVEPAHYEPPIIYFDKGQIARQALEG